MNWIEKLLSYKKDGVHDLCFFFTGGPQLCKIPRKVRESSLVSRKEGKNVKKRKEREKLSSFISEMQPDDLTLKSRVHFLTHFWSRSVYRLAAGNWVESGILSKVFEKKKNHYEVKLYKLSGVLYSYLTRSSTSTCMKHAHCPLSQEVISKVTF